MVVKMVKISKLKPYKNNAKKHPKEQVERISESIKEFGFTQPVLVDNNYCVVAGHGRVLGAKKAGLESIPVVFLSGLSEKQIKAYRLVDNKLNESEWNYELLEKEINDILSEGFSIEKFGLSQSIELAMYNIEKHKTWEYRHKHFLVTFNKGDTAIDSFISFLEKNGYEYKESQN